VVDVEAIDEEENDMEKKRRKKGRAVIDRLSEDKENTDT
jgi:hypothetical protein